MHANRLPYPEHPANLIRTLVIERRWITHALRSWVELWAYGKPMPALTDAEVAQVQLEDELPPVPRDIADGTATGFHYPPRPERRDRWGFGTSTTPFERVRLCTYCDRDATCRAFGYWTCESCQDEQHSKECKYPLHPAMVYDQLWEELEHAQESMSENRAEYGMSNVAMGAAPGSALIGFDAMPWLEAIAEIDAKMRPLREWCGGDAGATRMIAHTKYGRQPQATEPETCCGPKNEDDIPF